MHRAIDSTACERGVGCTAWPKHNYIYTCTAFISIHAHETKLSSAHICSFPVQDVLNARFSGLFGSGDDVVDKDNITVYECIVDEGEVDSRTDLSVSDELRASGDCPRDCTSVETSLQSSVALGYIPFKPQQ